MNKRATCERCQRGFCCLHTYGSAPIDSLDPHSYDTVDYIHSQKNYRIMSGFRIAQMAAPKEEK